jgi:hypothetical protein
LVLLSFFPAGLILGLRGPEEAKNLAGESPPPDSNPFSDPFLRKILPACQDESVSRNLEVAIGYAKFFTRSHDAVIRVYDEAGNVIETREHTSDSKGDFVTQLGKRHARA